MKYEEIKDLINNIIENEFNHIQDYEERKFLDRDEEQLKLDEISEKLFRELYKNIPKECHDLLGNFDDAVTNAWTNICRFYFKEGVRAGLVNLKFLNSIEYLNTFID